MKIKSIIALLVTLMFSSCATTEGTNSGGSVKPYPLKTCVVTGNDLGSMGDEQRLVYRGQEIKFCCEPCKGKFLKNPAKYLAKLP